MKVIDLTHLIEETMPVYPGTEPPILANANTIPADGFCETKLTMYSHTGTHIDAPGHVIEGRTLLDEFPASQFVGKAVVIDCTDCSGEIPLSKVLGCADAASADFLLFRTGWERYWGQDAYFDAYPYVSEEIIDFVLSGNYKGIGFDTIGLDPVGSLTLHLKLFTKDIINIENLKNLEMCGSGLFDFAVLPLKFQNADGAPARAVAIIQD
ncbi:MAG: cyclase family protein [Oscillospiraceae bacterium]|nr:cyclase family protein [Oscillospiraceae bacterium]